MGQRQKGEIRGSKHTINKIMYQNIIQSYNVPKARGSQWIFTLCKDGVQRGQGSPKDPAHDLQALRPSPDLPYAETIHRSPLPLAHICIPGLDPTRGPTKVQTTAKLTQHLTYPFSVRQLPFRGIFLGKSTPFCQLSLCIDEQVNLSPALLGRCRQCSQL